MTLTFRPGHTLLVAGLALALSACAGSSTTVPSATRLPAAPVSTSTASGPTGAVPAGAGPTSVAAAGSDLTGFDPCSVVRDSDLVKAITDGAGDPSALGTITATHGAVDGTLTGLPGAKACRLSWTSTDSAGRLSQGGDPVVVTFDLYSNRAEIQAGSPDNTSDYGSVGAVAFDAPGDGGDPHLAKDGYLYRMSGNSDLKLLKAIALGISSRL